METENDEIGSDFWQRADAVIALANEQCHDAPKGKVSASLMYATARFSAYIVAVNAESIDEIQQDREQAMSFFMEQFQKMLVENLDDYMENYEKYIKGQ